MTDTDLLARAAASVQDAKDRARAAHPDLTDADRAAFLADALPAVCAYLTANHPGFRSVR